MTKTFKVNGKRFQNRILGGYFQDTKGAWWLWNSQKGWVEVDMKGAAFRECMEHYTKASAILGRHFGGDIFEAERIIEKAAVAALDTAPHP